MNEMSGLLSVEILVFEVSGQRYGLPSCDVREVLRALTLTPPPEASGLIEGLFNLRGTVVPVLDIRKRFGLPAKPFEHTDHLIVFQVGERVVAVRADKAEGLVQLATSDVDGARGILPGMETIAGVAKLPDGLVFLHSFHGLIPEAESTELNQLIDASASQKGV